MPKLLNREARHDVAYESNRDHWLNELRIIEAQRRTIAAGGGEKAAARQRKQGKLLARERVDALIDDGTEFLELGTFTAWEIYQEWGGAPAAGVVTGLGRVGGRECVIVANDATVKAGAWFPHDRQEEPPRPGDRHREPPAHHLPRGQRGRVPAHAGRDLPRQGALRSDLPQQRRDEQHGHLRRSAPSWAAAWRAAPTCPS